MKMHKRIAAGVVSALALSFVALPAFAVQDTQQQQVEVIINPAITLNIANGGNGFATIQMTPNPQTSAVATDDHVAAVMTNNATGYSLTLSMISADADAGRLRLNTMAAGACTATNCINPIAAAGALGINTWGFNTTGSATNFSVVPAFAAPVQISTSTGPVNGTTTGRTSVTFGTRVDTSIAAGTYLNHVIYTAVANS